MTRGRPSEPDHLALIASISDEMCCLLRIADSGPRGGQVRWGRGELEVSLLRAGLS